MSEEDKKVNLGETGQIELPSIDITPYIGRKQQIASVAEYEGQYGYYVKVETEIIDTLKDVKDPKTGLPMELTASRIFGLQQDKDNNIGWGEKTKLGVFLLKMDCKHYKDLVGKKVVIQSVTNKADGKDYLTFN